MYFGELSNKWTSQNSPSVLANSKVNPGLSVRWHCFTATCGLQEGSVCAHGRWRSESEENWKSSDSCVQACLAVWIIRIIRNLYLSLYHSFQWLRSTPYDQYTDVHGFCCAHNINASFYVISLSLQLLEIISCHITHASTGLITSSVDSISWRYLFDMFLYLSCSSCFHACATVDIIHWD